MSIVTINDQDWMTLRILGDTHTDMMKSRIAMQQRINRAPVNPDLFMPSLQLMEQAENQAALQLRRTFRRVAPAIHAWVNDTPGLGERLFARLLGTIGHPVVATPHAWMTEPPDGHTCGERCGDDRHLVAFESFERQPSQLWQYCGVGSPDKRRKGMTQSEALALGKPQAKSLVHLIAEGCMKCAGSPERRRSPYRDIYDQAREHYETREEWTKAHKHNASLRRIKKAVLLDLWLVASGEAPLR